MNGWNSLFTLILVLLQVLGLALTIEIAKSTGKVKRQSPYAGSGNSFCYSIGGEGFHPHPDDCRKFIRCVEQGRRNGDKLLTRFDFDCAPGTVYDPDLFICNFPGHGGTPKDCGAYAEEPFPGKQRITDAGTTSTTTRRPPTYLTPAPPPEELMEMELLPGGLKPDITTTTTKPCGCNLSGTMNNKDECNPSTGQCKCKTNVQGTKCDKCKDGYFNMDPASHEGCSPCFCFGHTNKCHSAEGYNFVPIRSTFANIARKAGAWKAEDHATGAKTMLDWSSAMQDITVKAKTDDELIYYVAPSSYLGEQRRSYNKYLNFTLYLEDDGREFISSSDGDEDIIIEGAGGQKLTLSVFKNGGIDGVPLPNAMPRNYSFKIHPSEPWEPKLTEAQYLKLLSNLKSLKIRGTYTKQGKSYLDNVFLETLRKLQGGPPATTVEECECPTGYTGLSCESCAYGFKRASCEDPLMSKCIPCDDDCSTKCLGEDLLV